MGSNIMIQRFSWCPEHNHVVDYELVKEMKPDCIAENNGCGNCPKCAFKVIIRTAERFIFKETEK